MRGIPPSLRRAPPPNVLQVSRRGGDPGPAGRAARSERPALGHPHWGTRPGSPHTPSSGATRHLVAAARGAVLRIGKACGSPPWRGRVLWRGPAPRKLAEGPSLPFCVGSRSGLGPVVGVRCGGRGRGALKEHRWRSPSPSKLTQSRGTTANKCTQRRSIVELLGGPVVERGCAGGVQFRS